MSATRLGPALRRLLPRFSLVTLMAFMGLASAGGLLWTHWEPWSPDVTYSIPPPDPGLWPDHERYSHMICVRLSPDRRVLVAIVEDTFRRPSALCGRGDQHAYRYVSWGARSQAILGQAQLTPRRGKAGHEYDEAVTFARDGSAVLTGCWGPLDPTSGKVLPDLPGREPGDERLPIVKRRKPAGTLVRQPDLLVNTGGGWIRLSMQRRPEVWWGIFHLPELYATALCALALAWSVFRDARSLSDRRVPV